MTGYKRNLHCQYFVRCENCQILGFCQGFIRVSSSGFMSGMLGYAAVGGGRRGRLGVAVGVGGRGRRGRRGSWASRVTRIRTSRIRTSRAGGGDTAVGRGTPRGHRGTPHIHLDPLVPIPGTRSNSFFQFGTSLHIAYRPVPPWITSDVPMFQDIS